MNAKDFIVYWNNRFPYDKWWRTKYNIPFNSKKHREQSQIDIYFEYLEDTLYNKNAEERNKLKEKEEELQKGNWIKERESEMNVEEAFDKIDLSQINSQIEIKD